MSTSNYDEGIVHRPEQDERDRPTEPSPWCLACGYQHPQDEHCAGCNGDHSASYCMTDELAAELANVEAVRQRVEVEADRLFNRLLRIVHLEGGE